MAVVACINAIFSTHTHTHTFGVSRKNAVIDSNIYRVSWKKLSWQKGVIGKVSWIVVVETVMCVASWRRCRGKHRRHGKRRGRCDVMIVNSLVWCEKINKSLCTFAKWSFVRWLCDDGIGQCWKAKALHCTYCRWSSKKEWNFLWRIVNGKRRKLRRHKMKWVMW